MKKLLAGFFQMPELVNYYLCSESEEQGMITQILKGMLFYS